MSALKQVSRGADLYFTFRFLRLLTMDWKKTDAYKYKIIDAKGNALKKSSELESVNEKAAYTMLHRLVFKMRRLLEKVPVLGKSILLNYAAALFLLKEQDNKRIWTDENYMERELNKFLETDWEEEAEGLKESFQGQYGKTQTNEFLIERKMTDAEIDKREKIVLDLKKKEDEFKKKYGDDWKNVMYATATKRAMGEEEEVDESFYGKVTVPQINSYLRGLSKLLTNNEVIDHLKKHFNLKKIKFDRSFSKVLAVEEKEMESFTEFQEDTASIDTKRERIRKQREKMGLGKKKSAPEKKEKDSPIRRAAKKAGMSRSDRKGLYNQNEVDDTASIDEKRRETPDEWMKRTGKKPSKIKGGTGKAGKKAIVGFKKKLGVMSKKEKELDDKEREEREKNEAVEIGEGTALQVKMALDDVGLKGNWKNNKVYVNKKDVEKAKKALKGNVIYRGKTPEVVGEEVGVRKVDFVDGVNENPMIAGMAAAAAKKELEKKKKKEKKEEAPTMSAGSGAIAGIGVGPQGEPPMPKKKKKKIDEAVQVSTFAGKQVFVVDSDMFHQCRLGKQKYHRYEKYVGTKRIGQAIREYGLKFPKRPIILQNGEGGPMLFLRYGRS